MGQALKIEPWRLLHVFGNPARIEVVRHLLRTEMATLSDIATELSALGLKMSLPGLFKHMRILEKAGIVRAESGGLLPENPDARKTVYLLEGKERVESILNQLETEVGQLLWASETFHKASILARVLDAGPKRFMEERKRFEALLGQCESDKVLNLLTEDERRKVKLWRIMLQL